MSHASLPKPDEKSHPDTVRASWMSALTVDPNLRPVVSEAPRWPGPTELMVLLHELFREGSLDHAQMQVLSTLPELSSPTIVPAE